MFDKRILHVLLFSFFIKCLIGGFLPLSPDEAYYWIWSHHLQLSYYDHPPFVSWLFLLGQPLESLASFVRFPGMAMAHVTLLLWILLLKDLLSPKQLMTFTILSLLMPFVGPAGLIITPDTPMLFFWVACLLAMKWLIKTEKPLFALLLGICFGLGFCSKYPIVLILPILIYWLWVEKGLRKQSLQWIVLGSLGALLSSFPVWFWNLTNDLQSFGFQLNHGLGDGGLRPKYLWHYISAQVGLIFPTIFYFAWKARNSAPRWLIAAAVFPLAFFAT